MNRSLTPKWQDTFAQDDARTLHLTNLPVPGNPNVVTSLFGGDHVFEDVAALKEGIHRKTDKAPLHAKVLVALDTLGPQPPFSAFVVFATAADARAVANRGHVKLKGIECPVQLVQPTSATPAQPAPAGRGAHAQQPPQHTAGHRPGGDSGGSVEHNFVQCDRTVCLRSLPVAQRCPDNVRVTSPQRLEALLQAARYDVEGAKLLVDQDTGAFTGVGFVTLKTWPQARELLDEGCVLLQGTYEVKVSKARPPKPDAAPAPAAATATPANAASRPAPTQTQRTPSPTAQGRRFAAPPPAPADTANPRGDFVVDLDQGSRRYADKAGAGSPLHSRRMVPVRGGQGAPASPGDGDRGAPLFTAMTWNVLFRDFAANHKLYCAAGDLALAVRRGMMKECIARHRPDILALQELEVAGPGAPEYIKQELESLGYEVHSMAKVTAGSQSMDGCALAFRRDVFAARPSDVRKDRLSDRLAQVGIFARLHHRASGRQVVAATTHLKAGPEFERDRQAQMESLLGAVRECLPRLGADVPVVVLGDLNTEPRWELIPGLEAGSPIGPLRDAYANNNTANGPPPGYTDTPFTSYSWFLQGVADYVLHTDGLVPVKVLKVPGTRDVRALYAADYPQRGPGPRFEMLPCKSFPSDHVPLMVEFAFPVAADADADAFASPATADANAGGPTRHHDPWSQQPQAPHAAASATPPRPEAAGWGAARPEPFGAWQTRPRPGSNEHATAPAHGITDDDDVFGGAFDNVDAATDRNACDRAASAEAAVADGATRGAVHDADDCGSSSSSEPCDVDGQL